MSCENQLQASNHKIIIEKFIKKNIKGIKTLLKSNSVSLY